MKILIKCKKKKEKLIWVIIACMDKNALPVQSHASVELWLPNLPWL